MSQHYDWIAPGNDTCFSKWKIQSFFFVLYRDSDNKVGVEDCWKTTAFWMLYIYTWLYIYDYICIYIYTSSTAQGGGRSFRNRKPIGEVGCYESRMAERSHWWTDRWLRSPLFLSLSLSFFLSFSDYLLYLLYSIYRSISDLSIYQSINLSIYQSTNLSIYQSINLSIYQSINLSIYQSDQSDNLASYLAM